MVSVATFRSIALTFAEAEEVPHFEKASFRVRKKIFATLDEGKLRACIKLTPLMQSTFCFNPAAIHAVPNKWGKQGWTFLELSKLEEETVLEAVTAAYDTVAPAKLSNSRRA